MSRPCTTHHFACDCREKRFEILIKDLIHGHGHEDQCCCPWCVEALDLLQHGRPEGIPCTICFGQRMIPSADPDGDVMNTPCPICNENAINPI